MAGNANTTSVDEEVHMQNNNIYVQNADDILRASYYALLSRLLIQPPDQNTLDILKNMGTDNTDFGTALGKASQVATNISIQTVHEEYSTLFYGFGAGGEVQPYESLYLTGLLYDKPLALLRNDMAELGLEHSRHNNEPEDHAGYILEMMHGMISNTFSSPVSPDRQKKFFQSHVASWMEKVFEDIENAESAHLYSAIGTIGRLFIKIETELFDMAA